MLKMLLDIALILVSLVAIFIVLKNWRSEK